MEVFAFNLAAQLSEVIRGERRCMENEFDEHGEDGVLSAFFCAMSPTIDYSLRHGLPHDEAIYAMRCFIKFRVRRLRLSEDVKACLLRASRCLLAMLRNGTFEYVDGIELVEDFIESDNPGPEYDTVGDERELLPTEARELERKYGFDPDEWVATEDEHSGSE